MIDCLPVEEGGSEWVKGVYKLFDTNLLRKILKRRPSLRWLPAVALAVFSAALAGCSAPPSPASLTPLLPVTGSAPAQLKVHEYALVEESVDGPNHASFQQRVPAIVERSGLGKLFSSAADPLNGPNQALAPYGYRLAANPTPPFSSFALYAKGALVQRDILHFGPVSVKQNGDFVLSFETTRGEHLLASSTGVRPSDNLDPASGQIRDGAGLLASTGSAGDLAGLPSIDQNAGDGPSFGAQMIAGQPLYFYARGGQVRVSYAGRDLPYVYDQVVHGNNGSLAVFNPGSSGEITWFYALRDGVWYYVEAGVFQ